MPKKTEKGWHVDIRPAGRNGPRFRKTLDSKAEALAYERYVMREHSEAKEWQEQKPDRRTLSELCKTWYALHGQQLKSGTGRMKELAHMISLLGDPIAEKFTAKDYTAYRSKRLQSVTANTVNHELTYLKSLFNELHRLGEWTKENPLADVRKIKTDDPELTYLTQKQCRELLAELDKSPNSHARISARVALATGGRWGEVCNIKPQQVHSGLITFPKTKNGKSRSLPISPELAELILENAPLVDGMNTFKRAIAKLDFDLPKGQMTHVLRHTFASHFMINGGDILTLQRALGHGSITMTMRYAHLSPDHLSDVLKRNPLSTL